MGYGPTYGTRVLAFLLPFLLLPGLVRAQPVEEKVPPPPLTRILFVFDASQSMFGRWQSDMKISIAQRLLSEMLDSLSQVENLELALRVYGHQKPFPPQDCNDTRLEVPFGPANAKRIQHRLKTIVPRGTTPIAHSLEAASGDFPECDRCRNIIILITDGIEECGGDPCAVSRSLQKRGIALKPFIIGIGRNFKKEFDCVGTYFDATSEQAFTTALNVVISQALNSTTAQVNLLDIHGKPTETNVNMSFYDNFSGKLKYNFVHTLNARGLPDTLVIDPLLEYNLVVHTLPPVHKDSIRLTAGKHTVIALDAPQGDLSLKMETTQRQSRETRAIVRRAGDASTLNVHYVNRSDKYLVGRYDLEVLTLPRMYIDNVDIRQSHTTTVEIPGPGIAVIQKTTQGFGSLYVERDNRLEWVYNLADD
ncbi:MAG TPA: VWA domain-containing protein, partial [Bacteroidales bacterium]|nr:VWA domain-containing protein [Bacteroidales bacterium]